MGRGFPVRVSAVFLVASQLMASYALSSDLSPLVLEKHILPSAIQVQITPRGQKYFETQLGQIMGNLGITLEEGYFPEQVLQSDKSIDLDELEKINPEPVQMFKKVRSLLTQWLTGFSLADHRPAIQIGESGYMARFKKFGLITDQALMDQLGKRDGAVLAIELEASKIAIASKGIKAWDMNNEFLGEVGLEEVKLAVGSEQAPLRLRLPFYVRMNTSGNLEFEALQLEQNLNEIEASLTYKNLIVPKMGVIINGKTYYLNNQEVENYLLNSMPKILTDVRKYLQEFAEKQLPALLNQKAKEHLQGSLEQILDMEAPGTEPGDRRPPLKWGLILSNLNLKNSLNIALHGYVEDTTNPTSKPVGSHASRGLPNFQQVSSDKYDIGLSIDRSLINRVLNLSFQRKNFENIKTCDGLTLKMVNPPLMDYAKTPAGVASRDSETFAKLALSVEFDPDTVFLKKKVVISFDLIAKIRQMRNKTGFELLIHEIDLNSVQMDKKYYSWLGSIVRGKVMAEIKKKLAAASEACPGETEAKIPGSLPPPPEILGIKLDVNKVEMDPAGHLKMYMSYKDSGAKK